MEMDVSGNPQVIDADGHVMEDESLEDFLEAPYRGQRRLGSRMFPPPDVLHHEPVHILPGSMAFDSGPVEWGEFLDDVGISRTVMYASHALAVCNVMNRDWAIALSRAYNNWLRGKYFD